MSALPAEAAQPLSPTFVWVELNRRMDMLSRTVDDLDKHGSRGVDGLRVEVGRLRSDLEEHEKNHKQAEQDQRTARRWLVGTVVSLIVPLYPLLGWLLTR